MLIIKQILQDQVRQGNYLFFFNNGREQMKQTKEKIMSLCPTIFSFKK